MVPPNLSRSSWRLSSLMTLECVKVTAFTSLTFPTLSQASVFHLLLKPSLLWPALPQLSGLGSISNLPGLTQNPLAHRRGMDRNACWMGLHSHCLLSAHFVDLQVHLSPSTPSLVLTSVRSPWAPPTSQHVPST